jgi:cation diffusion facilitator family transporter
LLDEKMPNDSEEQRALKLAIYGNIFFAVIGVGFAYYTKSQAVLLDGVFSMIALIIAIITLYISRLLQRPDDDTYPFGYALFEPLLNIGKGLIIGLVMLVALLRSVDTILDGGSNIVSGGAFIYGITATIACLAIALYMQRLAAANNFPLLEVEVKNWFMDAVISGAVAGAFLLVYLLEGTVADPWLPYADSTLVIVMSLCFLSIPYGIIRDNWAQLSGSAPPDDLTEVVTLAIGKLLPSYNLSEHSLRIAKLGRIDYVQLYLLLTPAESGSFSTHKMDQFRQDLYEELIKLRPNITLDIVFTHDMIWAQRSVNSKTIEH